MLKITRGMLQRGLIPNLMRSLLKQYFKDFYPFAQLNPY